MTAPTAIGMHHPGVRGSQPGAVLFAWVPLEAVDVGGVVCRPARVHAFLLEQVELQLTPLDRKAYRISTTTVDAISPRSAWLANGQRVGGPDGSAG